MATYYQDYLASETGDLLIDKGDFFLGYSDNLHIENILRSNPGNYLRHPLVGVGAVIMNAPVAAKAVIESEIINQLTIDGYVIRNININDEPLPSSFTIDEMAINIDAIRP